jgi:transcriptional regulator GlxA family with amidase domain
MKKRTRSFIITIATLVALGTFLYFRLQPVFELAARPVYKGNLDFKWTRPEYDSSKKTVVILANNGFTEIFDLLAPYYLFNATGKANVYVIAEKKFPVTLSKGLFILPSCSMAGFDSLKIKPDVIVIPNLSAKIGEAPDAGTVQWIKTHYTTTNIILSICDGSLTAAATGLYDNQPITTHANDLGKAKKMYPKAMWKINVSVTKSGNLFSTAGVSNAVEGSLAVIQYLFGTEIMRRVMADIKYPYAEIKTDHKSLPLSTGAIMQGLSKVLFRKNLDLAVLLQEGVNEFELAALLDIYTRTAPASIKTYVISGGPVTSKYGLIMYPTGHLQGQTFDEVHVLMPVLLSAADEQVFQESGLVKYDPSSPVYPLDQFFGKIASQYGSKFQHTVKLMLDYN